MIKFLASRMREICASFKVLTSFSTEVTLRQIHQSRMGQYFVRRKNMFILQNSSNTKIIQKPEDSLVQNFYCQHGTFNWYHKCFFFSILCLNSRHFISDWTVWWWGVRGSCETGVTCSLWFGDPAHCWGPASLSREIFWIKKENR